MGSTQSKKSAWPAQSCAGVCLHITSLPGNYGIGEIGAEAFNFIDKLVKMKLKVWQFLPTGPTGFGNSPYQLLAGRAGNEMLIDVAALIDDGLLSKEDVNGLRDLPLDTVNYGQLISRKTAIVNLAASRFATRGTAALKSAYAEFVDENESHWLRDYAVFRALKNKHGQQSWITWPAPLKFRDPAAIAQFEKTSHHALEHIRISQFLFHRQWQRFRAYARSKGVSLFGDLPIYVALDSADAWTSQDLLCLNDDGSPRLLAGVPPDYFNEAGQKWGNPVYNWSAHAASGFQWWIDRLQHAMDQADLLRIDHFRGFESYWAIPADAKTAQEGEWLTGPGEKLFDALRDATGLDSIIAENLGIITPAVESLRTRYGMPGMKVLQFELAREDFDLADIETNCVCYTATHDCDTTRGWLDGSPGDTRRQSEIKSTRERALRISAGTAETIHHDLIRLAFASKARIALAPMQDYLGLGSEARLNTPGNPEGNWRYRMRGDQLDESLLADVASVVTLAGRNS